MTYVQFISDMGYGKTKLIKNDDLKSERMICYVYILMQQLGLPIEERLSRDHMLSPAATSLVLINVVCCIGNAGM